MKTSSLPLLPCLFCGRPAKMIQPIEGQNRSWNAYCTGGDYETDGDCGVVQFGLHGQTQEHVAGLWNRRAVDPIVRDFIEKFRDYQPDNKKSLRALRLAYAKVQHFIKP